MKKTNSILLLNELREQADKVVDFCKEELQDLSIEQLNFSISENAWSIAKCLEHLNAYSRYYVKEMSNVIDAALKNKKTKDDSYSATFFGNYFANAIKMESGKVKNKMNSPKGFDPELIKFDPKNVLGEFLEHQKELLRIIEIGPNISLGKIRIPVTLTRFIKINLGDTLRFIVGHQLRHIQQMKRVLKSEAFPKKIAVVENE